MSQSSTPIYNHVLQLNIHPHQRLLHVLDVRGRIVQQALALAQVGPQRRQFALGPKARAHQPILMQPPQPLRIADIGLATRHVLGIAR